MSEGPTAVCPGCEQPGPAGTPCTSPVCVRRALHRIPEEHFAPSKTAPDPLIGRMVGDYLVAQLLGEGGFGKVYLALQQPIGMETALKILRHEQLDAANVEDMLSRFEGEARAMARLRHPNIVRLLHYGLHHDGEAGGKAPYIVMEFVPGARSLKAVLGAGGLSRQGLSDVLGQLLSGLESAHALHIVHRDIKPENIMLQAVAGQPNLVRILDFGLAKVVAERSETSVTMGTPMYMAPEQLNRKNIGPWTDLYAVGVMTFEALTGRRPYAGCTLSEVLRAKIDPKQPLARLGAEGLPAPLTAFLERALAFDPAVRFRTAAEMRGALTVLLSEDSAGPAVMPPVAEAAAPLPAAAAVPEAVPPDVSTGRPDVALTARPAPPRARSKRRPWVIALVAVALLLGAAGATWFLSQGAADAKKKKRRAKPAAHSETTRAPSPSPKPASVVPQPAPAEPPEVKEVKEVAPAAAPTSLLAGRALKSALSNLSDARSGLCPAARAELARKLGVADPRDNTALAQAVARAQKGASVRVDGHPGRKTLRAIFGSDIRLSACPECAPDLRSDAREQLQARMGVRLSRRDFKVIGRSGEVHVEACDADGCVSFDYSCRDGCCVFIGMSRR